MFSNSLLEHIVSLPGNDKCLECQAAEPKWVSFPTGTFLCFKCARTHKKFTPPQTVKSLEVADFTKHEMNLLSLGGNFRFISLMNEYSVSLNEPSQEHKYQTIISTYYCALLEAEVNKMENVPGADKRCQDLLAQRPIYEIGGEINIDGKMTFASEDISSNPQNNPLEQNNGIQENQGNSDNQNINNPPQQSSGWGLGGLFGYMNSALHKTAQYMGVDEPLTNMQNKINENMEYYGVNAFVKNTTETVSNAAKNAVSYVKDKGTDLYENNQLIHNTVDGVSSGAKVIKDKGLEIASDAYHVASSYVNPILGIPENSQGVGANENINNSENNPQGGDPNSQGNNNPQPYADPRPVSEQLKDDQIKQV
ncbi:MAG: hypothetical protein MJ252_08350 [archaeon]|nr:hypothetical protein [archaeon]